MEYRTLGNTGLKVSRFGFGMMTLRTLSQSMDLLETYRNFGGNFFDNAELYGDKPRGSCETVFGSALKALQKRDPIKWRRSDLVITTKLYWGVTGDPNQAWTFDGNGGENEVGLSLKHLCEGMKASLKRTGLEYVDVVYAHRYDPVTPMEEIVRGFTQLIQKGYAFYWGTSMWPTEAIIEAYWTAKLHNLIPPVVEQPKYNMLNREYIEKAYLPVFNNKYNIATTIFGALDAGVLTGKYLKGVPSNSRMDQQSNDALSKWYHYDSIQQSTHDTVRKLKEFAENKLQCSATDLALGWCLKNDNVTVIILGAKRPEQLSVIKSSMEIVPKLTRNIMKAIDGILNNKPELDGRYAYARFGRKGRNFRSKL
eukprot:467300_1